MNTVLQYILYLAALFALAIPLGGYMKKVMNGEKTFLSRVLTPCENAVYKFLDEHPEYNETCKKVETKTSLIKKGLKEVLANENVPGAQIVEGKSISIK